MKALELVSAVVILAASTFCIAAMPGEETTHVVERTEMQAALTTYTQSQAAQRAEIQALLARPEVSRMLAGTGLDLQGARAAAATLEGEELNRLATQARIASQQLSGGSTTIVIGSTALLIILLIVILLLV